MPLLTGPDGSVEYQQPYINLNRHSQSQHSLYAKSAIISNMTLPNHEEHNGSRLHDADHCRPDSARSNSTDHTNFAIPLKPLSGQPSGGVLSVALNDTPATTAPNSPNILPRRQNSGDKITRPRPTTLDIPGLTRSAVSPDGKIAQRDIGAKLIIVMVGLPARGKSYITKKMARYLNWLQHDTKIFNVGERRRVAAGGSRSHSENGATQPPLVKAREQSLNMGVLGGRLDQPTLAAHLLINGESAIETSPEKIHHLPACGPPQPRIPELHLPDPGQSDEPEQLHEPEVMDQSAEFFDPSNRKAALIREQCAMETLDEVLDYVLNQGGSVGILDATNSTVERRKLVMKHIRDRAGPDLNVLFMESVCVDEQLLERNMRLKLSGPDYKDKDPEASLRDFKKRVEIYKKNYVSLGEYEEKNNIPYVQMVDVGRKVISHQIKGFLSAQAVYYLLNFNLAPRQIWITRHGESQDNLTGKLGGDSELTDAGRKYARSLSRFLAEERKVWEVHELDRQSRSHLPPRPGDTTPPNPHYAPDGDIDHVLSKSCCVWTSMLQRSIQTAEFFNDEEFDIKQMRMLNELNAGNYEGSTYEDIKEQNRETFELRRRDKLVYRYPGPGGESYLDVINRLRPVIVELERMTDHVLLIAHRSVARVLLAYFKGLPRDDVTDLDVPIGTLYCLEPKPYGVDFRAYQYNQDSDSFHFVPGYQLQRANSIVD